MSISERLETYFREHRERHLQELYEFLRIPSISSLSVHTPDIISAAKWLAQQLTSVGLENARVIPTQGHPIVYGEWLGAAGKPTILIYGHYDVQPVDPLELWETPPFEPAIRDGKLYARGASDDKGQVFMHIKAIEAMLKCTGELPVNVKFCLEGEEEIGSPHIGAFIEAHQDLLAADVLLISDTPLWEAGQPAICYGLKGLCGLQVDVRGPSEDLHSGLYGGMIHNPLHALAHLLSTLFEPDGRIAIAGFYDQVKPITEAEKAEFGCIPYDETAVRDELGVPCLFGEQGYTVLERNWARPTLDINGMWGGFQGEGTKTVIPAEAHAKITCRLVNDQDPEEILMLVERHLHQHTPAGIALSTTGMNSAAKPYVSSIDHPAIQAAARSYQSTYGVRPIYTRMGASIPAAEIFFRLLHLPIVLLGFGLPDENCHAPNEHFHLQNFETGLQTICCYYKEISTIRSL
ncbi:dipeptidase [Brevibacillus ruminantium]|uniref:Dipeptidase n=1 Tax=Brevibacillus ruminantium TaxID=2950604 RepID=A0ABY4WDU7_9BACL|nr:dipeptidase [Brevibacillus ruminantium]USG65064.1 dipeptidase [Brevibacillus ruminantium]